MTGAPPQGTPRRGRRRLLSRLLKGALLFVAAAIVLNLAMTPWVFHIGDRFTPTTMWDGYGTVHATNGGEYVLFTHLQGGLSVSSYSGGGCDQVSGCHNLRGSARMCTRRRAIRIFTLSGAVSTWLSTDGARTSISLQPSPARSMPSGFIFVFSGVWRSAELPVANTDNSFTEVFAPDGTIRRVTSTRDTGSAAVTLRPGTDAGFATACRALATGSLR